jgi:hypothetical protein
MAPHLGHPRTHLHQLCPRFRGQCRAVHLQLLALAPMRPYFQAPAWTAALQVRAVGAPGPRLLRATCILPFVPEVCKVLPRSRHTQRSYASFSPDIVTEELGVVEEAAVADPDVSGPAPPPPPPPSAVVVAAPDYTHPAYIPSPQARATVPDAALAPASTPESDAATAGPAAVPPIDTQESAG